MQGDRRASESEVLVDLVFQAAANIRGIAALIVRGFNLKRRELRVSDADAASTRFVS